MKQSNYIKHYRTHILENRRSKRLQDIIKSNTTVEMAILEVVQMGSKRTNLLVFHFSYKLAFILSDDIFQLTINH